MAGRLIAIGDIHGCAGALATLLGAIQPDTGDVEKKPLLDFASVDRPQTATEGNFQRRRSIERDAEFASQAIARTAWHQRQGRLRMRHRGCDLVHRSVAAPRDDRRDAATESGERQLAPVTGPFGHEHIR